MGVSGVTAGGGQAVEGGSTAENNEDGTGIETPPPAGGGTYTPPPSTVAVTNVTLPETRLYLDLETNTTATLTATVLPANATNKNVTWTSSHPQFATVDENGVVTVVAQGTTTITVTTVDGNKTASVIVEVHPYEDVAIIQAACDAIQEGDYTNLEVSDLSNQDQKNAAVLAVADTLKGSTTVEIMFSENKYWVTSTYNLFNLTVEVVPTFVLTRGLKR